MYNEIAAAHIEHDYQVVYSEPGSIKLALDDKTKAFIQDEVSKNIRGSWWRESLIITIIMAGSAFIVRSYIPAEIGSQTSAITADVSSLKESVSGIKAQISEVKGETNEIRKDIKDTLMKALDAKGLSHPPTSNDDATNRLRRGAAAIEVAKELNINLGNQAIESFFDGALKLSQGDSSLNRIAWSTVGSTLNYVSKVITAPPALEWVPLVNPTPNGFPGLYGLTEGDGIRRYGSKSTVPIERGAIVIPLRIEGTLISKLQSAGLKSWPEYVMAEGSGRSIIVLDKLHLRNAILKNIHIVYGGKETILENVTFISCTFELKNVGNSTHLASRLAAASPVEFRAAE